MSKSDRLWKIKENLRKQRNAVKRAKFNVAYSMNECRTNKQRVSYINMVHELDKRHAKLSSQLHLAEARYQSQIRKRDEPF